jgi:thiol-disulfide isomerase/thioredoxin
MIGGPASRVILAVLLTALFGLTACAGKDAVTAGAGTFDFRSPGGKTEIFYNPPASRGTIGELSGPDLMNDGKTLSLDDFKGQVVVLNLWGQWCGPCRGEADELEKAYVATKDLGVAFLGINVRDPQQDKAQDFVVDRKVTYPSIWDPAMRTVIAFGKHFPASVIPVTLVLDREHRVAAVYLKALLAEDLQPVLERLAAEGEAKR